MNAFTLSCQFGHHDRCSGTWRQTDAVVGVTETGACGCTCHNEETPRANEGSISTTHEKEEDSTMLQNTNDTHDDRMPGEPSEEEYQAARAALLANKPAWADDDDRSVAAGFRPNTGAIDALWASTPFEPILADVQLYREDLYLPKDRVLIEGETKVRWWGSGDGIDIGSSHDARTLAAALMMAGVALHSIEEQIKLDLGMA